MKVGTRFRCIPMRNFSLGRTFPPRIAVLPTEEGTGPDRTLRTLFLSFIVLAEKSSIECQEFVDRGKIFIWH
jgi:hypothetical protein